MTTKSKKSAPKPTAKKSAIPSTTFTIFAPEAKEVYLVGDFNDWQPNDLKARRFKDGSWRKSLALKAGVYQYLFLVDGVWLLDPANPSRIANPFGSENSVLTVG